jgi:PTH1 family peptidyl-tRNA hydrolase
MKLVIGLGNPGKKFEGTRHNTGFLVIDKLQKIKLPGVVVRKSDVFMNESGPFVKSLSTKYNIQNANLYIIHDDLDIPLGSFKIQFGRGPKIHNGLESIDNAMGTQDYWHVRVGIDAREPDNRTLGEEYVLQDFSGEEKSVIDKVVKDVCKKLESLLKNIN